jgi:hypothetical protein
MWSSRLRSPAPSRSAPSARPYRAPQVLRSCVHALRDFAGATVGETTVGGQQTTLPKGHGLPPGAAATGHIGAMATYAGESAAGVPAVEPAAQVIQAWCAAAQEPGNGRATGNAVGLCLASRIVHTVPATRLVSCTECSLSTVITGRTVYTPGGCCSTDGGLGQQQSVTYRAADFRCAVAPERRVCAACGLQVCRGRAAPNEGQFWRGVSWVALGCRAAASCGIGARGSYLWCLVLWRRVWWIRPPGCDCGFRHEQERDDYAAPTPSR